MLKDEEKNYVTSDIKLQAFLRLMLPRAFIGINKTNPHRVNFVFRHSTELIELVNGYISRKEFLFAPLSFAENIEQGKAMVFGDY